MTNPTVRRDERGAAIPIVGLLLVTIMIFTAFAIDLGQQRALARDVQADADVIALDLVRLADGRTEDAILSSGDYATVLPRSAAANGIDPADLVVEYGIWDEATETFTPTAGTEVPNAVQVTARGRFDYYFAQVFTDDDGRATRTAMAALDAVASFTLGSTALSVQTGDSPGLDFLLTTLLGDTSGIDIGAIGPGGAVDFGVTLQDLVDADGTVGSPAELLATDITAAEYAVLLATALRNQDPPRTAEADILDQISLVADAFVEFQLADIIDTTVMGPDAVADAGIDAFGQIVAGLQLINGLSLAELCAGVPGISVPGLASTSLDVCTSAVNAGKTVIGTVSSIGPDNFRTAQVDIRLQSTASATVPLVVGSANVSVNLPITLEAAGATGDLTQLICDRVTDQHLADTIVTPVPLLGRLGGAAPIATVAIRVLGATVATVAVRVDKALAPISGGDSFLVDDQLVTTTEQVPGSALALGLGPLAPSDVNVTLSSGILPPGLSLSAITGPLLTLVINPLLDQIENGPVVAGLLNQLGVGVTESDLTFHWADCAAPKLRG